MQGCAPPLRSLVPEQLPAVDSGDEGDDHEAEAVQLAVPVASPLTLALGCELRQIAQVGLGQAWAVVFDRETDPSVTSFGAQSHLTLLGGRSFHGVPDQVQQTALQLRRVPRNQGLKIRNLHDQLDFRGVESARP